MSVEARSLVDSHDDIAWSHSVRHSLVNTLGSNCFVRKGGWISYVGVGDCHERAHRARTALNELVLIYKNVLESVEPQYHPFPLTRKAMYELHTALLGLWQIEYLTRRTCHD